MLDQQISVNGKLLDNDSWRRVVGPLVLLQNAQGQIESVAQEFIIQCDSGAYDPNVLTERFQETTRDFTRKDPRVKAWFDKNGKEVIDWFIGDGKHPEIQTSVSMLPEMPNTLNKLHCVFEASALLDKDFTSRGTPSGTPIVGLTDEIIRGKMFFESQKYSLSVIARFGPTVQNAAYGPFSIVSISDQAGKARFTMSGPHGVPSESGLLLVVQSTTNYNGTHIITGFGANYFDTDTDFIISEASGNAAVGKVTKGVDNYQGARDTLLVDYLETAAGGAPNPTTGMVLFAEQIEHMDPRGDNVEVRLTSGPQSSVTPVVDSGGNRVERGLTYTVAYEEPEAWDRTVAEIVYPATIQGQCSINVSAIAELGIKNWSDQIIAQVISKAEQELHLGKATELKRSVSLDFSALSFSFVVQLACGYNGTISYSQSIAFSRDFGYQIWDDLDGFDHVQMRKKSRKMATITVSRAGEGLIDITPSPPPAEAGFQWLLVKDATTHNANPMQTRYTNNFYTQSGEFVYIRIRPRATIAALSE